ncbi:CDP-alcohol phosphatidyltransferase family protein [Variovorax sp. J22R24]|uniref:CDP-alcohol phosphatidyltransferase family protein n=1 Tax=Variovorax gracilis TaxID=3053502 RepID=UPI002574C4A6|nr:CDP-alcohol phosphatidyltransferase family protein [Variovorax sp. J22R24]MDM0106725.1 CDP-alcohol phosphatidyltransferase family protein [Variovorax sp. J22R24]
MSIYELKPRFQALLRPLVVHLHGLGVTANQVTVTACAISVALGLWLFFSVPSTVFFALIPLWMFLRMAFNAIDGMLAREHNQQTALGAFLNELADVLSDAALYLPFALIAPFSPFWIGLIIVLAGMSEFAGALGMTVGASRRYDGPLGKTDRAFLFGALGLYVALGWPLPDWAACLMPLMASLVAWTIVNRTRHALAEDGPKPHR